MLIAGLVVALCSLAAPAWAQANANTTCLQRQTNCSVSFVVHSSRSDAVRLQAAALGIQVTAVRVDDTRDRNVVLANGPGGSATYTLSDGCVTDITAGRACEVGQPVGSACAVQNSALISAALPTQVTRVETRDVATQCCVPPVDPRENALNRLALLASSQGPAAVEDWRYRMVPTFNFGATFHAGLPDQIVVTPGGWSVGGGPVNPGTPSNDGPGGGGPAEPGTPND